MNAANKTKTDKFNIKFKSLKVVTAAGRLDRPHIAILVI